MASRSFGSEAPRLGHLVTGKGGVAGEVDDLRGDVDDGFEAIEAEVDIIGIRRPVKLATAAALNACTAAGTGVGKTLTQNAAAVENIDGVAVVVGDRVLVKNQVAAKDNGIYTVTTVGTVSVKQVLTRATDADSDAQVKGGMKVWVNQGTANGDKEFVLTTNDPITVDTTALTFTLQSPPTHAATHITAGSDEVDGDMLDVDYTPTNYTPTITAPATHADHLTSHLAGINIEMAGMAQDDGCAASVVLIQAGQPNNTDTLAVGADTYQFLAAPAGATGDIEVEISAVNAEGTLDNLLAAALASGTETLFWEKLSATTLQLTSADAAGAGGNIVGADPSIVLDASSATNYSFNTGDVNMNTLAGRAASQQTFAATTITITTAMITATLARISFPFAVTSFQITATASGVPVAFTADTFTIDGNDVVLGLGTDLANGDTVHIVAYA